MSEIALTGRAAVVVCSTRAATGVYEDGTGPVIVERLRGWGLEVPDADVVTDGPDVGAALRRALDAGVRLVVTTGGTGIAPTDVTPEQTAPLLTAELPGVAEALRAEGVAKGVATAVLSRGLVGVAETNGGLGRALVVNLPGSRGGVKDGLAVLGRVLPHALDQLGGGDH